MRPLLLASALIVIVAVSAPSLLTRYLDRAATAGVAAESGTAAGEEPSRSAGSLQVEIQAAEDGHFYLDADVNFRRVHMLVDTGASVVALRRSDAEAAGIRVQPAAFEVPVSTANGVTYAAEAMLESIVVSGIEVRDVRALVLNDEQLAISLLGGSFLHRLARFEIADGSLIFEN